MEELTAAPPDAARQRAGRRFPWARLGIAALVALCLFLIVWGFKLNDDATKQATTLGPHIQLVDPLPGSPVVPAQGSLFVDLEFGWRGVLSVDGQELPEDQVTYVPATATLSFTPGQGKDIERFRGGTHLVQLTYWPVAGTRAADKLTYSWSFTVV